jgi:hypothetical protein
VSLVAHTRCRRGEYRADEGIARRSISLRLSYCVSPVDRAASLPSLNTTIVLCLLIPRERSKTFIADLQVVVITRPPIVRSYCAGNKSIRWPVNRARSKP